MDAVKGEIISWIYLCIDVTCIICSSDSYTMIPHDSICISYVIICNQHIGPPTC